MVVRSMVGWLVCAALLLAGCRSDAPETAAGRPTLGVSVLTMTHPFFQTLVDALRAEAEAQGFEVVLVSCEFDIARQQNQVSDFIVQQVDAIALSPCDSKAVGTSIRAANEAGIPVFTFDIAALVDDVDVVTHVGIANYDGGRQAAAAALDALGREGQIGIVDHPEVESVIQRTRGFREGIEAAAAEGAAVAIVSVLPGGGAQDRAFRAAEDMLQAHPELDLIFGINDETALGAVAAIERAGKTDRVRVVGFGGKEEALAAVRSGKLVADVITHPDDIGRAVVQAVARYRSGDPLPPETLIPTELYTHAETVAP